MAHQAGDEEIIKIFYEESKEHLEGIEDDLLALEKQGEDIDVELVNSIFRAVHTIKGGCGFFGLDKLSALSHSMENVLDRIRKKDIVPNNQIVNVLLQGADLLKILVNEPDKTPEVNIDPVLEDVKKILTGSMSQEEQESSKETVDIKLPDGRVIFSVSKYEFERARKAEKGGSQTYLIEYDLINDIELENKTPLDIISELQQLAVFIDSKVDVDNVGELREDGNVSSIPFYVLISTIIETDLIYDFLGLDEKRIHLISENGEFMEPGVNEEKEIAGIYPETSPEPETTVPAPEPTVPAEPEAAPPEIQEAPPAAKPEPAVAAPSPAPVPVQPEPQDFDEITAVAEREVKRITTESIRVNVNLLDTLMSLAGELVLARNQLLQGTGSGNMELILATSQKVDLITAEIQEAIMATRMQSIGIVFNKFNRLVRDMAHDLKKEIKLTIDGEDVELDKSIIESIGDPLTHLVRNSLDHGIELPAERQAVGKPVIGQLRISAYHEAGHVVIQISDDGTGIDIGKIKAKAVMLGIYSQDQIDLMSDKDLTKLIFRPGFSTAEKVTDISGRGVGMDVVQTNLNKLGGSIDIDTEFGTGTTITVKLPLTLAIIPSLLLSAGEDKFAIPQVNLVELVRIATSDAQRKIERVGNAMVIRLRDRLLPLIKLSDVIDESATLEYNDVSDLTAGAADGGDASAAINIAVVMAGNLQYGLIVDNLLDTSEIVVKPLGRHLQECKAYAGATILGDGHVALILDVIGISEMMELVSLAANEYDLNEEEVEDIFDENVDVRDKQTLLIVHNAPNEPFGIPLGLVARIEKISAGEIEETAGRKTVKYRDGTLPLFRLEEVATVTPVPEASNYVVVVFKVGGREVGMMLSEILDVVETDAKIDDVTHKQTGIFGSAIINNRITLLIDLYGMVYSLMPNWLEEHKGETVVREHVREEAPVVLVAEDSRFFLSQIKGFMEDAGYKVVTAEDGLQAWQVLEDNPDGIDLVLTDIEMPNMDGFEFTEKVRDDVRFQTLPVLAITSIAGSAAERRGRQVGLDEYLIKLDRDEIVEKCSYYLKHGRK